MKIKTGLAIVAFEPAILLAIVILLFTQQTYKANQDTQLKHLRQQLNQQKRE